MIIKKSRLLRIANLALPIIAGALATNVMSLVDTLMVAQLGDTALAGVGVGGQLFFLLLAVLLGLAAGVQATVARRVGEDRLDLTGKVLNAGILLSACIGALLVALAYALVPPLFALLNEDPLVVQQGLAYLTTRFPSLLFIGINIAFRSYWIGVSQAKWSMVSIVTLSVTNVIFNYLLIFGNFGFPRLETAGAGLGSTLATLVALLVNLYFALKLALPNNFLRGLPQREQIKSLLRISYPESLRQVLFSLGVVLFYILVGLIGTRELAAFHVVISICLIAYLPHLGIGGAATTLVGEALGRKDVDDAKLWGWQVSNMGLVVLTLLSLVILVFPQIFLGAFFVEENTLRLAILPLQIGVLAHVITGYSNILGSALIGAGATRAVMLWSSLLQWLLFLPLLGLSVRLGYGLVEAFWVFLIYSILSALAFAAIWHRGKWSTIEF
ncbi:MAG: MATE family efflux transporter [Pseudomonadales bacterium]